MMVSKEQFITATEFANRYNRSRPIAADSKTVSRWEVLTNE